MILRRLCQMLVPLLPCLSACAGSSLPPPRTVDHVDVQKYMGTWYEIARLPFWRQDGCHATTASYRIREDGNVDVLNQCRDGAFDGKLQKAKGTAYVVDKTTNARLEVEFFWPFRGDYWVLELGQDYEYAVVGTPNYTYLWILSRTPVMDDTVYQGIADRMKVAGYDTDKLIKTPQKP